MRGRSKGGGEFDFIRLVTDTTYCIGHKSSYSPNLSFKQIILGGDASAVSLLSRGLRKGGGMEKGRGNDGGLSLIETHQKLILQDSRGMNSSTVEDTS